MNLKLNFLTLLAASAYFTTGITAQPADYIRTDGVNLVDSYGKRFNIRGTNIGHWLNPEGYIFKFPKSANSASRIDQGLCELVGPEYMDHFWRLFRENYITRDDIFYIASTGATTLRLPFHYKVFTDECYLGLHKAEEGFALIDRVIGWCREAGVRVILDMHDCPGGQTGDNIDDSYGYPWLFCSPGMQEQFIEIWRSIAAHYADDPTVLGYDLMNEPIAHYFEDRTILNKELQPLMIRTTHAIREVDTHHILFIAGAQWNTNFDVYDNWTFDNNLVFTCHIYKCPPTTASLKNFTSFRDRSQCPIYMGETGENTDKWIADFRRAMDSANMGWTFWGYKRLDTDRSFVGVPLPTGWEKIVNFLAADRSTYESIRKVRPDQAESRHILDTYLENCLFRNCWHNESYIEALGLKP